VTINVVRFETGSTDDARLASSNGIATSGNGSASARRASRRYRGVRRTTVVSRLSTTVVSAARTHKPNTGVSRPRRPAMTSAVASKKPSRSSNAASGTPTNKNASAGHNDDH
jgi:hypothetical protein